MIGRSVVGGFGVDSVVALKQQSGWTVGALWNHIWRVAGGSGALTQTSSNRSWPTRRKMPGLRRRCSGQCPPSRSGWYLGLGYLAGFGKDHLEDVGGLGTAQRNTAAGVIIAIQNFSDPNVFVMLTLANILGIVLLLILAKFLSRDNQVELKTI